MRAVVLREIGTEPPWVDGDALVVEELVLDPPVQLVVPAVSLAAEGRTIRGSYMGSTAPQRDLPRLVRLWRAGRLPVERLHTHTITLDGLPAAMDALRAGEVVRQVLQPH